MFKNQKNLLTIGTFKTAKDMLFQSSFAQK